VDWQGSWADLPTFDLTHLFATFWTPEQRREEDREEGMLRRYLEILEGAGVRGYGWEQLRRDYRLSLIFLVLHPVWDAVSGSGRSYWWPKLACLTGGYRDWGCEALLQ
jgi:hypothetical protein